MARPLTLLGVVSVLLLHSMAEGSADRVYPGKT